MLSDRLLFNHNGQTIEVELDLFLITALERMEAEMVRPPEFLDAEYSDTCRLSFFDYLRETGYPIEENGLVELLEAGTRAIKRDRRFRKAILALAVDDNRWTYSYCPELRALARHDFAKAFPRCHNLILAGLLRREEGIWCMDRLFNAGINAAGFHRQSYAKQRAQLAAVDGSIFDADPGSDMAGFYDAKIEDAMKEIGPDGRRNHFV